jgi:hypothetical protein
MCGYNMSDYAEMCEEPCSVKHYHSWTEGLDPRIYNAGDHFGKMFDKGVYLATDSSEANTEEKHCVLVVEAAMGEPHSTETTMQYISHPPERPDGHSPPNSVVAWTLT